ncbi:MAG: flagellar hook-length control protein FliK [Sulfuricellaceae bacterium]|nr:flagellar hook-length control protein FliK [Sulfuricellaceae bacterium]
MIHNDALSQLQFLIKTSAPPLLEISQQELELPQLVPGQRVPAHVIASLPNGRFEVLIADKTLDMNLPKNTQAGDTLELVFVTPKPRLTFILASDLNNVANPAGASNAKSQVTLSETAKFLGGLLEKTLPGEAKNINARGEAVSTLAKSAPVSAGMPADIPKFAQALRNAVTQSGLFYESHQAQWVSGQRLTTELLNEPQGRLSPVLQGQASPSEQRPLAPGATQLTASPNNTHAMASPSAAHIAASPTETPPGQIQNPLNTSASSTPDPLAAKTLQPAHPDTLTPSGQIPNPLNTSASSTSDPLAAKVPQPAHPDTLPIVRQQIEALDSRQILWQGQVWPGQAMDWTIEERSAREQRGEEAQTGWQTQLHLIMPQLGEIGARLALHPSGIRLQLDAPDEATAKLFAREGKNLEQSMESAGLKLIEMNIRRTDMEADQK